MEPGEILNQAEGFLQRGQDSQALEQYQHLDGFAEFAPIASFRMGEILNRRGQIHDSFHNHQKAFELSPALLSKITPRDFKHHSYLYQKPEQVETSHCPLCHQKGREYSCYNTATYLDFAPGFDPIRLWMICDSCHHIFASHRPRDLEKILRVTEMGTLEEPDIGACPGLGQILKRLMAASGAKDFFEVGVGVGEMIAVAMEYGLDSSGIEIRPQYAQMVQNMFSIPIHTGDFLSFESEKKFDIIGMGDVLEHFVDPLLALRKSAQLLKDSGVLWISTPNFESAYCKLLADRDPMWRVCEHLHFFSFQSLKKALKLCELEAIRYDVSPKYRGSMEVTIRKK